MDILHDLWSMRWRGASGRRPWFNVLFMAISLMAISPIWAVSNDNPDVAANVPPVGKNKDADNVKGRALLKVGVSPDSKTVFAAAYDGKIYIWDLATHRLIRCVQTIPDFENTIPCIDFSQDGKVALVGMRRGHQVMEGRGSTKYSQGLSFWDLDAGMKLRDFDLKNQDVNMVLLSPDGKRALSSSHWATVRREVMMCDNSWLTYLPLSALKIWATSTDRCLQTLSEQSEFRWLGVSPDGKAFVAPFMGPQPPANEKRTWFMQSWEMALGDSRGAKLMEACSRDRDILGFGFSGDGKLLATVDPVGISLWDGQKGTHLWTKDLLEQRQTFYRGVYAGNWTLSEVAFSPDGKRLVVAGPGPNTMGWVGPIAKGGMFHFHIPTGETLSSFGGNEWVGSVCFTPDGTKLISTSRQGVRVWDADTRRLIHTFPID